MPDSPMPIEPPLLFQGRCENPGAAEAARQIDVVHTSLAGMTAIVLMLLAAVALPIFGRGPVVDPLAFGVMVLASFIGIAGLYLLNYRVHWHVTNQARLTEVLVNSLGQGFVVFGRDGICESVYSQACLDLLETVPAGKPIADVLAVPEKERGDFEEWLAILFKRDHALAFEDIVRFFPKVFPHSASRRISLVYRPIFDGSKNLVKAVVIATDLTEEYAARQAAKKQQNFAEMICHIFRDRNQFQTTLAHVRDFLESSRDPAASIKDSPKILRQLHTLKAAVKQFNLTEFGEEIHAVENALRMPDVVDDASFRARLQEGGQRIGAALLRVTNEVSSLIGTEYEWRGNIREIAEDALYEFSKEMERNGAAPALVRSFLTTIVAVPIRDCFRSFERELYELARFMDKQVKPVRFEGENPRILARPLQEFFFSLTHICRNAIDHGIEAPITRMARGKDAAGQVTISCEVLPVEGGEREIIKIVISDDGGGIDPSRVRARLSAIDPDGDWRFEDDAAVIQRIFSWGFTTTEKVTSLSGRGVGLEAVDREVKRLGGSITVTSELYKGARFEIRLPHLMSLKGVD